MMVSKVWIVSGCVLICNWSVAAKVSINQLQYLVMENDSALSGSIIMDKSASENVTVQVAVGNGSATGNVMCNNHYDNDSMIHS